MGNNVIHLWPNVKREQQLLTLSDLVEGEYYRTIITDRGSAGLIVGLVFCVKHIDESSLTIVSPYEVNTYNKEDCYFKDNKFIQYVRKAV